ncbi:MAG: hypothetical protein ACK5LC_18410 [Coprobacillaceae bacterium]
MKNNKILEIYGMQIMLESLMYIHLLENEVQYFLHTGEVIKQNKEIRMRNMMALLKPYDFIKVNKKHIVNEQYIQYNYPKSIILLNGLELLKEEK